MFGDGREERMEAFSLEVKLRSNPSVRLRQQRYLDRVVKARREAFVIGKDEVIRRLVEHNPSYVRSLLETENERHGCGALEERYARTFCNLPSNEVEHD